MATNAIYLRTYLCNTYVCPPPFLPVPRKDIQKGSKTARMAVWTQTRAFGMGDMERMLNRSQSFHGVWLVEVESAKLSNENRCRIRALISCWCGKWGCRPAQSNRGRRKRWNKTQTTIPLKQLLFQVKLRASNIKGQFTNMCKFNPVSIFSYVTKKGLFVEF